MVAFVVSSVFEIPAPVRRPRRRLHRRRLTRPQLVLVFLVCHSGYWMNRRVEVHCWVVKMCGEVVVRMRGRRCPFRRVNVVGEAVESVMPRVAKLGTRKARPRAFLPTRCGLWLLTYISSSSREAHRQLNARNMDDLEFSRKL